MLGAAQPEGAQFADLLGCKMMQCSPRINIPGVKVEEPSCFTADEPSATCSAVLQPASPPVPDLVRPHPFARAAADAAAGHGQVLAGHKRACEAFSCGAESEEEDASMANSGAGSQTMCRSGSARTLSMKRVCSVASADALSPFSAPPQQQQQQQLAAAGSCANLLHTITAGGGVIGSHAAAAAAAAAKRRSKTGSSCLSQGSMEPASTTQASLGAPALPCSGGARCGTGLRGPRVRLGGRLLSPEEAQRHLQAAAAAAVAALASRSASRAPSPAAACADGAGAPHHSGGGPLAPDCSTSVSAGGGLPPSGCGDGSISSALLAYARGGCGGGQGAPGGAAAAAPAPALVVPCMMADDCLPEDFIPTPEQVGAWQTLASTLDDDGCGGRGAAAAAGGQGASPRLRHSYTQLLLSDETGAAAAGGPAFVSAFAPASGQPWPAPAAHAAPGARRQGLPGAAPHACSGVAAPVALTAGSAAWSAGRSSGSFTSASSLASTPTLAGGERALAAPEQPGGASTAAAAAAAHPGSSAGAAVDAELAELLRWAPPSQMLLAPVAVHGSSSSSLRSLAASTPAAQAGAAAAPGACGTWKPAFSSAFAPPAPSAAGAAGVVPAAGPSTAAAAASGAAAPPLGCGMMPTPGLPAPSAAASMASPPYAQQPAPLPTKLRIKTSVQRGRRSKQGGKPPCQQPAPLPPLQPQPQLVLPNGEVGQQVVLSQEELLAVMQQNMAASFASGYMLASSMQQQQGQGQAQQVPLLAAAAEGGGGMGLPSGAASSGTSASTAAAAAAVASMPGAAAASSAAAGGSVHLVDDILPSLQDLLTDCC